MTSFRTWPGFRPWSLSILSTIAVFEFLAAFAWRTESGRLLDPTTAAIAIPAGAFALIAFAALLLSWLARVPVTTSLSMIARLLPFACALPLIDLIRSYGNGLAVSMPILGGSRLLLASVTGGLLPIDNGIAIGIRSGVFTGALVIGIAVWHHRRSVIRAVIAAVAWSALAVHLVAALSASLFWRSPFAAGTWGAAPHEVARRIVTMLSGGYWWSAVYERFVTSTASPADVAGSCATAAAALIALGTLLIVGFLTRADRAARIVKHAFASWGAFDLLLYAAIGIGAGISARALPATGYACVPAMLLFVLLAVILRFGAVMKRDLFRLGADERDGIHQPIASGELAPDDARAFADISAVFALASAFVLGWPVFAPTLAYLAASRLTRERSSGSVAWAFTAYRAIGAGALAYAALAFVSQGANVSALALTAAGIAAGHRLFVELFWLPRMMGKPQVTSHPPSPSLRGAEESRVTSGAGESRATGLSTGGEESAQIRIVEKI